MLFVSMPHATHVDGHHCGTNISMVTGLTAVRVSCFLHFVREAHDPRCAQRCKTIIGKRHKGVEAFL